MEESHKIHLSSKRIKKGPKTINKTEMVEEMIMAEEIKNATKMTKAEIAKETEIREAQKEMIEAEEETAEGNHQEKNQDQVRIKISREIVLDLTSMAVEVEMTNGSQKVDRDQEVGHTPTSPGADNLGMKKSKEVGLTLSIKDQERNGTDPDLAMMIRIEVSDRNIILIVRTQTSRIGEETSLKIRDEVKVRPTKKDQNLIELDMIENSIN